MILRVAICIFLLTGCVLDDIAFDSSLKGTIVVEESSAGENVEYAGTILLNATEDTEIEKYKDKIVGVTVNKIEYKIEDYNGPEESILMEHFLLGIKIPQRATL